MVTLKRDVKMSVEMCAIQLGRGQQQALREKGGGDAACREAIMAVAGMW